jgi:hypothetical protein
MGRLPSLSRHLLRKLHIDAIRHVVDFYDLPRARSMEEMVDLIVRRVGHDLVRLVSAEGPFPIDVWNETAIELGGQARRSFEAVREELAFRLDRVVLEFDIDEKIFDLRDDPAAIRRLAQLLDIDREQLETRLQATHGRTLLGRFVAELREERPVRGQSTAAEREDWDDDSAPESGREEMGGDAPALLPRLLKPALALSEVGSAWPARGVLSIGGQSFDVDVYARVVGGSARGNPLERRFQNPSQQSPIKDDPARYELLFGLWIEQGEDRAVIVAFDAYRRVGRTTRFSMFMPLSLLEQAADTGFATHENNKGETLYAFRPENIGRYVQILIDAGLWTLARTEASPPVRERVKPEKPRTVETLQSGGQQSIYIRPRVGMYAAFARLNYKPWFALAEFVDNSIQSCLAHRGALVEAGSDGPLVIDISLDDNEIVITDRAGGIAWRDFPRAFSPAAPPDDPSGLSEFGLGMKAAACWFARRWSVRTSALGEAVERNVTFDIPTISRDGLENLPIDVRPARDADHYTVVTMTDLRVHPRGRTLGKIKDHLASIYRVLTKDGVVKLRLTAGGKVEELDYSPPALLDAPYYRTRNGPSRLWRTEFEVDFNDKKVTGWAGIMRKGSHAAAGFSVFRRRRLIEGSVGETYKPSAIFGNPNSFASQRVVGEIFVEGFDVTHTKDGIQWHGYEDEMLESVRRQINSPSFPLLDQADGYRARKTADQLPPTFGADALTDTAEALSQNATVETLREQAGAEVSETQLPAPPAAAVPILQERDLRLQIVRDGKPWNIHLQLVRDPAAAFYSTSLETRDGVEFVTVQLNLEHDFSVSFINDNETVLQPMMRFIAALALGERLARDAGVKNAGTVRLRANDLLRTLASDRGQG